MAEDPAAAALGVWTQDFQEYVDQPRPAWGKEETPDLSSAATRASTTLPLQVGTREETQGCREVTRRQGNKFDLVFQLLFLLCGEVTVCQGSSSLTHLICSLFLYLWGGGG